MNLREKDLMENLKIFEKEVVVVEYDNEFESKFELYNTSVSYNYKKGYLVFKDRATNNKVILNISMILCMELVNNVLNIDLEETELKIYIK